MSLPHKNQIVINKEGYTRKVLEVLSQTVLISIVDEHSRAHDWYTEQELRDMGYTWEEEKWEPQKFEPYFFITEHGNIAQAPEWSGCSVDKARRDFLGVYPTREKAMEALQEIKQKLSWVEKFQE